LGGTFADDGGYGGGGEHNFVYGGAAWFIATAAEELGEHTTKRGREHGADLRLLICWEYVNDPVNGFAGVVGVKGAEDEQAGFSSGESEGNGLKVTHLADEHDVSIFTQSGAKAIGEGWCLNGDFALGKDRFFIAMNELDGFLDGDDVAIEVGIDVVE
jgi:hypothetical protein